MQVHEVMSRNVLVASPDDTIEKAAALMAQAKCGALPVGENERLVGMITTEILRFAQPQREIHLTVARSASDVSWRQVRF